MAFPCAAQLRSQASWSSTLMENTYSVAWGDVDGDGDLDLAVGNAGAEANRLYRNDAGTLVSSWVSSELDSTHSVAWADYDGDGDLDLAVGNGNVGNGQPNRLYRNDGGVLTLVWTSPEADDTNSIAWGDWDGDGDPDLAVANAGMASMLDPDRVYRNDAGTLTLAWTSAAREATASCAWGDINGDRILDLVTGTTAWPNPQPNRVYLGDGVNGLTPSWAAAEVNDKTFSVALADVDRDGDIDVAVGNNDAPAGMANRLYLNDGAGGLSLSWTSPEIDPTDSLAWGDWDGDGDLDLAVGNRPSFINRVYRNEGGALELAWCSAEADSTYSVAWGDVDGDGDLDLAVGNAGAPNRIYLNDQNPCSLRSLGPRVQLKAVKDGAGGAIFSWTADPAASEYHVNEVRYKADLVAPGPYRPPVGVGSPTCEAYPPTSSCTDPAALSGAPLRYYQVVSSCGPCGELEGPV